MIGEPAIHAPMASAALASDRVRLAELARQAVLRIAGVTDTDTGPGGRFVTEGDGRRVEGVVCIAAPEGGYELSVRLVCGLVPLPALGQRVQEAVRLVARQADIAVAAVSVHIVAIHDLLEM